MRFGKRNDGARLERNHIDVHIVGKIAGIQKPCRSPSIICTWHRRRFNILLLAKLRCWTVAFQRLVAFTYPLEPSRSSTVGSQLPGAPSGQKCQAPHTDLRSLSVNLVRYRPLQDDDEALDLGLRLRMGGTAARRYFNHERGEGGSTASNRAFLNPGP